MPSSAASGRTVLMAVKSLAVSRRVGWAAEGILAFDQGRSLYVAGDRRRAGSVNDAKRDHSSF